MNNPLTDLALKANLQTAQNRMFPFVKEAMDGFLQENQVGVLEKNPGAIENLFFKVQGQLFDLLNIPLDQRFLWHMGIADSGKRTIELLVNCLCPAQSGANALLDTENYVGFNKFSAATSLKKQKAVAHETPFAVNLGHALSVNSPEEFHKLKVILEENRFDTLWIPWNSTSTGIREDMAAIVDCRNRANSQTLLIADAASLRLFSKDWQQIPAHHLPDIFFFSLRKQGLPYDGPNDEVNQARNSGALMVFNQKALQWAQKIDAGPLYESPTLSEFSEGRITRGEQRTNHIKHLLKLDCALTHFLDPGQTRINVLDEDRSKVQSKIMAAFSTNGSPTPNGFSLYADPQAQSDSAYILTVPETTSAKKVVSFLKEKGILISVSMHPKMESKNVVRFAFYPGNSQNEVDYFLEQIKTL